MRSKSPKLKADILEYINAFYRNNGRTPTSYEIGAYLNVSNVTAYRYLVEMNKDGMLQYNNGIISTDVIGKCSNGMSSAPVVGSVTCGDPTAEEENIEEYVNLPESVFGKCLLTVMNLLLLKQKRNGLHHPPTVNYPIL